MLAGVLTRHALIASDSCSLASIEGAYSLIKNILDLFHVKSSPIMIKFHEDDSGVPPQGPKTPFHRATPPKN